MTSTPTTEISVPIEINQRGTILKQTESNRVLVQYTIDLVKSQPVDRH